MRLPPGPEQLKTTLSIRVTALGLTFSVDVCFLIDFHKPTPPSPILRVAFSSCMGVDLELRVGIVRPSKKWALLRTRIFMAILIVIHPSELNSSYSFPDVSVFR